LSAPPAILVIKLSALGDIILAFPAFQRIRDAHPDARISLLTTPPYADLARASPYFDSVEDDGRPATPTAFLALIRRLRAQRWTRVYDLQGNDRTNLLFQLMRPTPPPWSGVAFGCALPHGAAARTAMHTLERQAAQLEAAGIWPDAPTAVGAAPGPDIAWLLRFPAGAPREALEESRPVALLVPGAAPRRPAKRWPAAAYGELAKRLLELGFAVQIIGGAAEIEIGRVIEAAAPGALNVVARTDVAGIAALGARAAVAVGNDTGPLHLIAAAGAPTVALFSADSDPALCAPRGRVAILRDPVLANLPVDPVLAAVLAQSRHATE
jgi:ADP-heptose:LPS heptosyltransferase